MSILLAQCQSRGQLNRGTSHPTPENIPAATDPSLVIDISNPDDWEEGPFLADTTGFTTAVFGREDGEDYELLAWVRDIAYDGKNTIFVLDADPRSDSETRVKVVHMVSVDAQYQGSFGRMGEGPGEFLHPDHLLVADGGNTVLVAGRERHIDVFRRSESGVFRFERRIDTRSAARDACTTETHFYFLVHDEASGHIIHKYTMDGEYVIGFGNSYKSSNPLIVGSLSDRGHLLCNKIQGVVGFVPQFIPVLTGYSEEGELLWRLKVDGLTNAYDVLETVSDGGAPAVSYSSANWNEKGRGLLRASLAYGDSNFYVFAQMALGDEEFRTWLFKVDALSGEWEHIGHGGVPPVLEKDLMVSWSSSDEEGIKVRIRSRKG